MIDYFALGIAHALIVIAVLRVVGRPELDHEDELDDKPKRLRPVSAENESGGDA